MRGYSNGDQLWVSHREPDGEKNHRANNEPGVSPTPHATSLAQSRPQSRCAIHWRTNEQRQIERDRAPYRDRS